MFSQVSIRNSGCIFHLYVTTSDILGDSSEIVFQRYNSLEKKTSIIHELLLYSLLMCYNLDLNLKKKI